jgi:hypothetical protein
MSELTPESNSTGSENKKNKIEERFYILQFQKILGKKGIMTINTKTNKLIHSIECT